MVDLKSPVMTFFSAEDVLKASDLPWLPGGGKLSGPPLPCLTVGRCEPWPRRHAPRGRLVQFHFSRTHRSPAFQVLFFFSPRQVVGF